MPTHGFWFDNALGVLKKNALVPNPSVSLDANPGSADKSRKTSSTVLDGNPTVPIDRDIESNINQMIVALPESTPRLEDIPVPQAARNCINFRIIYPTLLLIQVLTEWNLAPVTNPSGILLFRPPECGKTFIAKSIAKTLDWTFMKPDIGAIRSNWIGDSEKYDPRDLMSNLERR